MKVSLISAVNNEDILNRCLLNSPDIQRFEEIILQRGFDNVAAAYNPAISSAKGEILVFIHQDVYLPAGWYEQLESAIEKIELVDLQWGILGVYGVTAESQHKGYLYCTANQCILGKELLSPVEVDSLDEVVLIIRKNSQLSFDENLKGFHLYGTDLCLFSRQTGLKCYAISAFCVHNANEYGMFPRSFWRGYFYLRSKWKLQLPVKTPCVEITKSVWPVIYNTIRRFFWLKTKRKKLARRVDSPAKLYTQISQTLN